MEPLPTVEESSDTAGRPPWRWERRDLAIDVVDKLVLAQAIGLTYDRLKGDQAGG